MKTNQPKSHLYPTRITTSILIGVLCLFMGNICGQNGQQFYKKSLKAQSNQKIDSSIFYIVQAVDQFKVAKDTSGVVKSLYNYASLLQNTGQFNTALELMFEILELKSNSKNDRFWANMWNKIGTIYKDYGQNQNALEYFQKAIDILQKEKSTPNNDKLTSNQILKSRLTNNRGSVYLQDALLSFGTDRDQLLVKAGGLFNKSIAILDTLGETSEADLNAIKQLKLVATRNLGEVYYERNENVKALNILNETLEQFFEINDKRGQMITLRTIAEIYRATGNFDQSQTAFNHALNLANNLKDNFYQSQLHDEIHLLAESQQDYRKALVHSNLAKSIRDSIFSEREKLTFSLMQSKITRQENEKRIDVLEQESRIQTLEAEKKSRQLIWIGVLFLLAAIAGANFFFQKRKIEEANAKTEALLLNILPKETAHELKVHGKAIPRRYESVTVLFADFENFTQIASNLSPEELIRQLDSCFSAFDAIMMDNKIEKIKTIGDAYMSVAGLPTPNDTHALQIARAALAMQEYISGDENQSIFKKMRIGIHSGPVVAGVVGHRKFAFDIWGDTVNIASRMESNGTPDKVNISKSTFELIESNFKCSLRGEIEVKGKGNMSMYYIEDQIT